jgi:ketosteroid isomerase-like protein
MSTGRPSQTARLRPGTGSGEAARTCRAFEQLAADIEVTEFTPLSFTSNDSDVMVVIRFGLRVPATGKSGTMDIHHRWRFRDGKICFYRGTEDTSLTAALLDSAS